MLIIQNFVDINNKLDNVLILLFEKPFAVTTIATITDHSLNNVMEILIIYMI